MLPHSVVWGAFQPRAATKRRPAPAGIGRFSKLPFSNDDGTACTIVTFDFVSECLHRFASGSVFATITTMKLLATTILSLALLGAGCSVPPSAAPAPTTPLDTSGVKPAEAEAVLPIAGYASRRTYKMFGEYISDRFSGYHIGDDVEYGEVKTEVPVIAIAQGTVRKIGRVSGYGGVVIIQHTVGGKKVNAIYGHLDLASSKLRVGASVARGDFIANLGDGESTETDGERKHLHFALYEGDELRLSGYEKNADDVRRWLNPTDLFLQHKVELPDYSRAYNPNLDLGGSSFKIRFAIPGGMEVEYVPQLKALNIFTIKGEGTARERSQLFIRYFDASGFQTLSGVTVYDTKDITVGQGKYAARRYDIEPKPGVADFAHQPAWRNARHIVTDFTGGNGVARYYVVAKNPKLTDNMYEAVLASMQLVP